jgi:predicted nucleic acid-binding protein
MTHLLDTSALLAHYLGEPGGASVQSLFEDESISAGTSILALFEFESRLQQMGVDASTRARDLNRYGALLAEIVEVNEAVRVEALRLRTVAATRLSAMDTLIAATAVLHGAVLVHRDPHFAAIPTSYLKQEVLPAK